jgi:hypothetical protein
MGMSFYMYLCDKDSFEKIKNKTLNKIEINLYDYSIKSYFLEKIYNGLEFIFNKIFPKNIVKIIFCGSNIIISIDFKSDYYRNLSKDEQIEIYIDTPQISYINHDFINKIYELFLSENGDGIYNGFNENELNENKIYSDNWEKYYTIWHNEISKKNIYMPDISKMNI